MNPHEKMCDREGYKERRAKKLAKRLEPKVVTKKKVVKKIETEKGENK